METKNQETIKKMLESGITEIHILEGAAPNQPERYNPKPVDITGSIDSPLRFLINRDDDIEFKKSFAKVERGRRLIVLTVNEQSVVDKYTITGKFLEGKKFTDLNINSERGCSPKQLANILKLQRSIFSSPSEHSTIVSTLRNLKAKINRQIEDADDRAGNVKKMFEQQVESNMPKGFNLKLPLFEGEENSEFEVVVTLEADGSDIICCLESVEAAEKMDEIVDKRFDKQVEELEKKLLVIEG